jgi:hypothetical protein
MHFNIEHSALNIDLLGLVSYALSRPDGPRYETVNYQVKTTSDTP